MESIVRTLKLLGHPARLRILSVLQRGELTVSELTTVLGMSQPRITQYIGALEDGGLVERLREGSWVFVRLRSEAQTGWLAEVLRNVPADDPVLSGDIARLAEVRSVRAGVSEAFFRDVANNHGQLSHEFLPSAPTEAQLLQSAGDGPFSLMVDLGTGSGRMLELFSSRVRRGVGIDRSPDMLKVARHKLAGQAHSHLSIELGSVEDTGLEDGCADLVTLHQVLHYLDEPGAVLAEAARILAPGGRLLVADFAAHDRDAFRDAFAHRRLGFAPDELTALLSRHGFADTIVSRIGIEADAPDILVWSAARTGSSQTTRRAAAQTSALHRRAS